MKVWLARPRGTHSKTIRDAPSKGEAEKPSPRPKTLIGHPRDQGAAEAGPAIWEATSYFDILPAMNGQDSNCYATLGGRACRGSRFTDRARTLRSPRPV